MSGKPLLHFIADPSQDKLSTVVRYLRENIPLRDIQRGTDPKRDVRWLFVGFDEVLGPRLWLNMRLPFVANLLSASQHSLTALRIFEPPLPPRTNSHEDAPFEYQTSEKQRKLAKAISDALNQLDPSRLSHRTSVAVMVHCSTSNTAGRILKTRTATDCHDDCH